MSKIKKHLVESKSALENLVLNTGGKKLYTHIKYKPRPLPQISQNIRKECSNPKDNIWSTAGYIFRFESEFWDLPCEGGRTMLMCQSNGRLTRVARVNFSECVSCGCVQSSLMMGMMMMKVWGCFLIKRHETPVRSNVKNRRHGSRTQKTAAALWYFF